MNLTLYILDVRVVLFKLTKFSLQLGVQLQCNFTFFAHWNVALGLMSIAQILFICLIIYILFSLVFVAGSVAVKMCKTNWTCKVHETDVGVFVCFSCFFIEKCFAECCRERTVRPDPRVGAGAGETALSCLWEQDVWPVSSTEAWHEVGSIRETIKAQWISKDWSMTSCWSEVGLYQLIWR